jgi:type IV secretory pathway VirB3-like protein
MVTYGEATRAGFIEGVYLTVYFLTFILMCLLIIAAGYLIFGIAVGIWFGICYIYEQIEKCISKYRNRNINNRQSRQMGIEMSGKAPNPGPNLPPASSRYTEVPTQP